MSMTPTEVCDVARSQYNVTNDSFFDEQELFDYLTDGCRILSNKAKCIRKVFTTTTVADQREYAIPTNCHTIKRIELDGKKLDPFTWREDDAITGYDTTTADSGESQYYATWGSSIFLRPTPSDAWTLKIYAFCRAQRITTATSALETPDDYEYDLAMYLTYRMALKDQNYVIADRLLASWEKRVIEAVKAEKLKTRGDAFSHVQAVEVMNPTTLGTL